MTVHQIHPDAFPLSIGFLSPHNTRDRRALSGSVFFAARALKNDPGLNVRILGEAPGRFDRFLRKKPCQPPVETMDLSGLDTVVGRGATPAAAC